VTGSVHEPWLAGEKLHPLLPVELCFGTSWAEAGSVYHARFVALPHLGETVCLPHRQHGLYKVIDVRHQSATPTGDSACVRLLLMDI
jgi:hypothetical protein